MLWNTKDKELLVTVISGPGKLLGDQIDAGDGVNERINLRDFWLFLSLFLRG